MKLDLGTGPSATYARGAGSPSDVSLKELLGGSLQVGCAIDGVLPRSLEPHELGLITRHFNVLTPENCMKPAPIQPVEGEFHFERADSLVRFAEQHGHDVVGHCLVWHQQCPEWVFLGANGNPASRAQVLDRMRTHIATVVGRYRGRIKGWDVVNEAIADRGDYLRQTQWLEAVGPDFIEHAFRFAHEADPKCELYYNDFNNELPDKLERTLRLLRELQSAGVRLDGVGIQGHWMLDKVPFDDIEAAILAYHRLGLKVMFTELDLDVIERPDCGADVALHHAYSVAEDIFQEGMSEDVVQRQAEQYARLFELFHKHRDKVTRVTFWGLHDGRSWLNYWPGKRTNHPLLFDRECRPKQAFERIAGLVTTS